MWTRPIGIFGFILAAGCSASDPADPPPAGESEQAIYGGVADTQNTAVMALVNVAGSACSGTTIAVNGQFGYLLTAAHCVVAIDSAGRVIVPLRPTPAAELLVVPGADWLADTNASTYYPVLETRIHSSYDGAVNSPNDIALVRYIGAAAATPVIPAISAAEDDLAVGTLLTYVGYGITATDQMNTRRFRVDDAISSLNAASVTHNKSDGTGVCSGDSGGPAIRTLAAGKRVAAVTSYSTGTTCATGTGVGVRVSAHASFIQQFLGMTPPAVSCGDCRGLSGTTFGGCAAESLKCQTGTPCGDFLSCANACADDACLQRCATQHAQGAFDYTKLNGCACKDCATECSGQCDVPACGLEFTDMTCNTCNETNCCNETTACADDFNCFTCATASTEPASCVTNALYRASRTCTLERCGAACGTACGFNNPGVCGQCLNGSCCAVARTCALDSACNRCATGTGTPQTCANIPAYVALFDCLGTCPGDPCGVGGGTGGTGGTSGTGGAATGGSAGAGASAGEQGSGGEVSTGGTGAASGAGAGTAGASASAGTLGASADESRDSGGCGCRTPRGTGDRGLAALALLALALGSIRRLRARGLRRAPRAVRARRLP